jgi:hypothetical protein
METLGIRRLRHERFRIWCLSHALLTNFPPQAKQVENGGIFPLPPNSPPLPVQDAVPAHDRGFLLDVRLRNAVLNSSTLPLFMWHAKTWVENLVGLGRERFACEKRRPPSIL